MLIVVLASCGRKIVSHEKSRIDTTIIEIENKRFEFPESTVAIDIPLHYKPLEPIHIVKQDQRNRVRIDVKISKDGKLSAEATALEIDTSFQVKHTTQSISESETIVQEKRPNFWTSFKNYILIGLSVLFTVLILIWRLLRWNDLKII